MIKAMKTVTLTVALLCGCLGLVAAAHPARADVTVAVVAPLSGLDTGTAAYLQGVLLAVDTINADGGLLGQKLRLVTADDGCDEQQAEAAAERVLADHPQVVIGSFCSASSIRAAPLYAQAGVIQIAPNSTNPRLTEMGITTVFRMIGRDDRQGDAAVTLIARQWPQRHIAIIDDGSVYGQGLADIVRGGLAQRGIPVALTSGYAPNATNYDPIVHALKEQGIDVLYASGYSMDIGLLIHEIAAAGLSIQVVGGDILNEHELVDVAGVALEGLMFTYMPDTTDDAIAAPVLAAARQRGVTVERRTLQSYAAIAVWSEAVKRAQSFETATVAAALRGPPIPSVIGPVSFDAKGDIIGPVAAWVWYRWHDGVAGLTLR
ncbi:MAG: branched-chain amino acid ABC transporter substrate-binding protein [Azospirillaceae bacterium]|nr:branched-chain amino acid ABC transporter substrate-binding protein [Azospirillaceae bacterium]